MRVLAPMWTMLDRVVSVPASTDTAQGHGDKARGREVSTKGREGG